MVPNKNGVGSWNYVFCDKCNSTMDHVVLWEQQRISGQVGTSVYRIGRWASFTPVTLSTYLTVRRLKTQRLPIYIVLCINLLRNLFCFEKVAGIVSQISIIKFKL